MAQQYPPPTHPMQAPPPTQGVGYPTQQGYQPVPAHFPPGAGATSEAPPPYFNHPPPQVPQQQSSTNVVVVSQQPTLPTIVAVHPVGDHYMTMSVVLTILCVLSGFWWALFCTIPAIIFSSMAQDDDRRGDYAAAQTHGRVSLGLNIAGLVSSIALIIVTFAVILPVAIVVTSSNSYDNTYCYYYC